MTGGKRFVAIIRALLARKQAEDDLAREIASHLTLIADDFERHGMSPDEARLAARRAYGGVEQTKQAVREERGVVALEQLVQDVHYGLRQLRRSRGFTLTALLLVAVGLGMTTAMYSIVYAVMLTPLPLTRPERLVAVGTDSGVPVSLPTIEDWESDSGSFESIAAYTGWAPKIESSAGTGHANALLVSRNFFPTLGIPLWLGRDFTHLGNSHDCFGQAIVTYGYWRRMGGGDKLADRTIRLDHRTYTVVGVVSPSVPLDDMDALDQPSILSLIGCDSAKNPDDRGEGDYQAIARLRPGVSTVAALQSFTRTQKYLVARFPRWYPANTRLAVKPLGEFISGSQTRSVLLATLAACGVLLLISCTNLTNLLLARNSRRRSEFALRAMLGARPLRLYRQIMTENTTLVALGSIVGVGLAAFLVNLVSRNRVLHLPRLAEARIGFPSLAFAVAISTLIAVLLTVLPVLRTRRLAISDGLRGGPSGTSSAPQGLRRTGRLLVASQIALAFVLVAASGWMVSSVVLLLRQPLGFDPDHIVFASTDLRGQLSDVTPRPALTLAKLRETMTALGRLPGVMEVAAANDKPLGGRVNRYGFCSDIHPDECQRHSGEAPDVFLVTPGYFHTVRQAIQTGRAFNDADDGRNHVAIVNHALAEHEWPGENPLGHQIFSGDLDAWATVVGEVADVHSYSLERKPLPNLYLPEADKPDTSMTIMLRTAGNPSELDEAVRRALRNDTAISVRYVQSMPELMAHAVVMRRFSMWVVGAFGLLSLALSTTGTYALVAYETSLREREIGIRLALGAQRSSIMTFLIGQETPWIIVGLVTGLASAVVTAYVLRSMFYHAAAASVPVLASALALLAVFSVVAVAIPGRRASLLEPSAMLRHE